VRLANLASAIDFVMRDAACAGETYVVADPEPVTIAEIVTALRRGRGKSPGLIAVPPLVLRLALTAAGRGANWEQISGALAADPAKLVAAGWRPEYDTLKALAETV
jgi:NAD dependent epimerase/dehydratase family enzyme